VGSNWRRAGEEATSTVSSYRIDRFLSFRTSIRPVLFGLWVADPGGMLDRPGVIRRAIRSCHFVIGRASYRQQQNIRLGLAAANPLEQESHC
jgi:hypothetical protein